LKHFSPLLLYVTHIETVETVNNSFVWFINPGINPGVNNKDKKSSTVLTVYLDNSATGSKKSSPQKKLLFEDFS